MRINSTAPCRLSLFGGGSDIPIYSDFYGGLVISLAINLRQHLTLYTGDNLFDIPKNSIPYKGNMDFIHKIFTEFDMGSFHDVRFTSESDALLESGLGASAVAVVATIGAINQVKKLGLTKAEIAERAWEVESLSNYGGRQDHYASTYGGFNAIIFSKNLVEVNPLNRKMIDNLLPSLVLMHTNITRTPKIQDNLKKLSVEQIDNLTTIKELATQALKPLSEGDIEKVGSLLDQSWEAKKKSNRVSNQQIDEIYKFAKQRGAIGGKLCGSGSGGYMIFVINPTKRDNFIKIMESKGLDWFDFSLDYNGLETRIL